MGNEVAEGKLKFSDVLNVELFFGCSKYNQIANLLPFVSFAKNQDCSWQ